MKINNNCDEVELDCYLKIINFFQNEEINKDEKEIWKSQSLIELMKFLDYSHNKKFVANAIVLILSLFEDTTPDMYDNRGVDINQIPDKDRRSLITELKNEFLPN
ncbi:MAG: hypothetical protein ACFFHD_02640 [Promethearchaeota archaeon]